jgi:hypothetical protein
MIKKFIINLKENYIKNPKLIKSLLLFSFFIAFMFLSPILNIILDLKPEITNFSNHIMSNGSFEDLDISKRILNYYKIFIAIIFLTTFVFGILYSLLKNNFKKEIDNKNVLKLFNTSLVGVFCATISVFYINLDLSILFLALFSFFLFLSILKPINNLNSELYVWPVLTSFPFAVFGYYVLSKKNFFDILPEKKFLNNIEIPVDLKLLVFGFLLLIISIALFFLLSLLFNKFLKNQNSSLFANAFLFATLPILFIVIAFSLMIEFINIINLKFNYVFHSPLKLYFIICFLAIVISIFLFLKFSRNIKFNSKNHNIISKYYYPLLTLNFAFIITQPWRMITPPKEFFETANSGIAVDHFFRYGSIPIIENFDAHMMSSQFFAYIYGFLNGYEPWSPFLYSEYFTILLVLTVFYILKTIIGATNSFLIISSLPIISLIFNQYSFAAILVFPLLKLYENNTKKNSYWFWMVSVLLSIYRLDIGFAAILSALVTFFILNYLLKKKFEIKNLLITGSITFGTLLSLFSVLCLIKGINPFSRLIEFLGISASNQNWVFKDVGDVTHFVFRLTYYVLPIITISFLMYVLFKSFFNTSFINSINNVKVKKNALVFFVFFTFFFVFNSSRGIVRHSYHEGTVGLILSTTPFALLSLIYLIKKQNKLLLFLSTLTILYFLTNQNNISFKNSDISIIGKSFYSEPFKEKFQEASSFNGTRCRDSYDSSESKLFKQILDEVLTTSETYFDFSSTNYYYALVARKNPVYVNQSPLLLNGDKTQKMALEEFKNSKASIVLLPKDNTYWRMVDGINVDYKYYSISEYIYQNYIPLFRMASFDAYALKSKKAEYLTKITNKGFFNQNLEITDFSAFEDKEVYKENLQISKNADGKYVLTNIGSNSIVSGLIKGFKNKGFLKENPSKIKFNITTANSGTFFIYYTLNEGEKFVEEVKKTYIITEAGTSDIDLDLPKSPIEIMISLNNIGSITLNSLKTDGILSAISNQPEIYNNYLGETPRLFGEKSNDNLFDKVPSLKESITESGMVMNQKNIKKPFKPFYLYFQANSQTEKIIPARVELTDDNNHKNIFNFNIASGNHKYAIRLSSNYIWWNSQNIKVTLKTDIPIEFLKYSMISEDGIEVIPFKNSGLTLSNITDNNWNGGVGQTFNFFLLDYSPNKLKSLKENTQILFKDGRKVRIANIEIAGNYLHVSVVGNVKDYLGVAAYPNVIELVK